MRARASWDSPDMGGSQPPPRPPGDSEELTTGERFRRRIVHDPLGALLWLRELERPALNTLKIKDLKRMIYNINDLVRPSSQLRAAIDQKEATEALQIVRGLLFSEPMKGQRHAISNAHYLGFNLKGRTLRGLFMIGILVGAQQFVAELFTERMSEQIRTGRDFVNTEWLAMDLADGGEWQLAADLFPGPESDHPMAKYIPQVGALPAAVYTPRLIAIVMTANLVIQQPWRTVQLFSLLERNQVSSEAYCALIQAQLHLGDVAAAKQAVHRAHEAGIDSDAIQLAMLRGHRMLGFDVGLEQRLRQDLTRLGLAPRVKLVNALGRLCLDAGNLESTEQLLGELHELGRQGEISPDDPNLVETALISLSVASRRKDVEGTRVAWSFFDTRPHAVTDHVVAQLCRALIRLEQPEEAALILEAAVSQNHPKSPWPIPDSFVPGILTGNTVLEAASLSQSYEATLDVLALMRVGGIEPDKRTVIIALKFAATTLLSSPKALAKLLEAILERTRDSPTVDQINIILAEVVRIATLNDKYKEEYLAPKTGYMSTEDPSAGIEVRGALRTLLAKQISILRDQGQMSTGASLSNRLLYDALALDGIWPVQAVQKTWQSFVLRGFRPTAHDYVTLISAFTRIGAMREAEDTYEMATSHGTEGGRPYRPPAASSSPAFAREMLTVILQGWAQVDDLESARRIYLRIRELSCGPDATALDAIVNAHVMAGQVPRAIEFAKEDIALVEANERLVTSVAHAIRKNHDTAGAIFFVSHFTVRHDPDAPEPPAPPKGRGRPRKIPVPPLKSDAFCSVAPAPGVHWTLTPKLLHVVRKALNYLAKKPTNEIDNRMREAMLLANRMLDDDKATRPFPRGRRRLNMRTRHRLADAMDISRSDRVTAAVALDNRRRMRQDENGNGSNGKGTGR